MKYPELWEIQTPLSENIRVFLIRLNDLSFKALASCEPDGWGHVSVSLPERCPTWDEMCFIKDLFFDAEEICIQIHPKKSEYINLSKYCLHIWRPPNAVLELLERK